MVECFPHLVVVALAGRKINYKRKIGVKYNRLTSRIIEMKAIIECLESWLPELIRCAGCHRKAAERSIQTLAAIRRDIEGATNQQELDQLEAFIDAILSAIAAMVWAWPAEKRLLDVAVFGDKKSGYIVAPLRQESKETQGAPTRILIEEKLGPPTELSPGVYQWARI